MNILVDWLTISIKAMSFQNLISILKIPVDECRLTGSRWAGRFPVEKCLSIGGIEVHFGEYLILNMSGGGCRLLESIHDNNLNWIDFIEQFLCLEGSHMSRLDIACDDYPQNGEKELLSFDTMLRHRMQRRYVGMCSKSTWTGGDERKLVFGSPHSERLLRIYDKALERGIDGHWIRAEFQLRNDAALSFYMRALELGSIGQAYQGMLHDYLRFTREVNNCDNHQNRLTVTRWWKEFCAHAKRIKGFYVGGLDYNLESLERYLGNQTSSSMKTYLTVHNGDVSELMKMADSAHFNKKQEFLIKTHPLIEKMNADYGKQAERDAMLEKIVGNEPRTLTRQQRTAFMVADREEQKYQDRLNHWVSFSPLAEEQQAMDELKRKQELLEQDLEF